MAAQAYTYGQPARQLASTQYVQAQPGQPGQFTGAQYIQASGGYTQRPPVASNSTQVRSQAGIGAPTVSNVRAARVIGGGIAGTAAVTGTAAVVGGGNRTVSMTSAGVATAPRVVTQQGNRQVAAPAATIVAARGGGSTYAPLEETAAPYLRKFFEERLNQLQSVDLLALGMSALSGNSQGIDEMQQQNKSWFETSGKALLVQSFQHHDLNQNNVLEPNEAQAFFQHLIDEQSLFATAMAAQAVLQSISSMLGLMGGCISPEEKAQAKAQCEFAVQQGVAAAKADSESRVQNYLARKQFYDAAAFDLVDANKDGTIRLDEFLAALDPDSDLHARLNVALGFQSEAEYLKARQQKEMQLSIARGGSPCPQQ